jgi:hypothetical protein
LVVKSVRETTALAITAPELSVTVPLTAVEVTGDVTCGASPGGAVDDVVDAAAASMLLQATMRSDAATLRTGFRLLEGRTVLRVTVEVLRDTRAGTLA